MPNDFIKSDTGLLLKVEKSLDPKNYSSYLPKSDITALRRRSLAVLKDAFPGGKRVSRNKNFKTSEDEFGSRLIEGWKTHDLPNGKLGFEISHDLDYVGSRARTVLTALNAGQRAHTISGREFVFYGTPSERRRNRLGQFLSTRGFVRITRDRTLRIPARRGSFYLERTRQFMAAFLEGKVSATFARKMAEKATKKD